MSRAISTSLAGVQRRINRTKRVQHLFAAALVVLVSAMYLADLGQSPLWGDELRSAEDVAQPFTRMLVARAEGGHQPVYFSLLYAWRQLVGENPAWLRSLNLIFFVSAAMLVYVVARRLASGWWAVLALALFALNAQVIYLTSIIRPYALVVLCTAAVTWLSVCRQRPKGRGFCAWVVLLVVGLASHFSFVPVVVAAALAAVADRRPDWRRLVAIVLSVLLWLPLCWWAAQQFQTSERLGWLPEAIDWRSAGMPAHHVFSGHASYVVRSVPLVGPMLWIALAAGVLALQLIGAVRTWRSDSNVPGILWATAILLMLGTFVVSGKNILLIERYVPGLLVAQTLLMAAALAFVGRKRPRIAWTVAGCLIAWTLLGFVQNIRHDVWVQHYG